MEDQQQLSLPYEILGETLGRGKIRDIESVKNGRNTWMVPYDQIRIRPGYNIRSKPAWVTEEEWEIELEVEQLARQLLNGKDCPDIIKGDFTWGNNDMGEVMQVFSLSDGERRCRAIGRLLKEGHTHYPNGKAINMVEVLQNPIGYTEYDRNRQFMSTNNNMKYTDLQWASLCQRMKHSFFKNDENPLLILSREEILAKGEESLNGWSALTNDDIAKDLHHARQWVDNMLILHGLPDETKRKIYNKELPYSTAISDYRKTNKEKKPQKELTVIDQEGEVVATLKEGESITVQHANSDTENETPFDDPDPLLEQCKEYVSTLKKIGTANLQREFEFGYNRAFRIMCQLRDAGIIREEVEGYCTVIANEKFIVDTHSANEVEEDSHKTRATFAEQRPSKDREDALMQQDFKTEKEECEFNLNEVVKLMDKLEAQIKNLPDHVPGIKQAKGDMTGLINGIILPKIRDTQDKLKNAPTRGAA